MISHNSKIECGTGDVNVGTFYNNGKGGIFLAQQKASQIIGSKGETPMKANVVISFSDPRSINVWIKKLQEAKRAMYLELVHNIHLTNEPTGSLD